MTRKRHATGGIRPLPFVGALLCASTPAGLALARGDARAAADVEVVVVGHDTALAGDAATALCGVVDGLGLGVRFVSGHRCGRHAGPAPCRARLLAVADPRSDRRSLERAVAQLRRGRSLAVSLVVLRVGREGVPTDLDRLADRLDNGQLDQSALALSASDAAQASAAFAAALEASGTEEQLATPIVIGGPAPRTNPPRLAVASTGLPLLRGTLRLLGGDGTVRWISGRQPSSRRAGPRRVCSTAPMPSHVMQQLTSAQATRSLAPIAGPPALLSMPPWQPAADSHAHFAAALSRARSTLFLTTRDGLLHAVDAESGHERLVFVPASLLPRLASAATRRGGGQAVASSVRVPTTAPKLADVRRDGVWTTALLYGAGPVLTLLDVRAPQPRALTLPAPLTRPVPGRRWQTPAMATRRDGALAIAASERLGASPRGALWLTGFANADPDAAPAKRWSMERPTAPVIEQDRRTAKLSAVLVGDGRGTLWRLAAPRFEPNPIAQLGPAHPFVEPPAVLHDGPRVLVAAVSTGADPRLVLWRPGQPAASTPLSDVCRSRGGGRPCRAPLAGLSIGARPLLVASARGAELLLLLAPREDVCASKSSWLLRIELDRKLERRGVRVHRLGASASRQVIVLGREIYLIAVAPGRRPHLRPLGPPLHPGAHRAPHIESYRESR